MLELYIIKIIRHKGTVSAGAMPARLLNVSPDLIGGMKMKM
jgi:hypothetical protein